LAESVLEADQDAIRLDNWLLAHLLEQGIPELRANDEIDMLLPRVVNAVEQQLRRRMANGLISPYAWADKSQCLLARTDLELGHPAADRASMIIRLGQDILAALPELTGRQFEHVCDLLLSCYGIPIAQRHVTRASHEGGIDFVAIRKPRTCGLRNRLEGLPFRLVGQATRTTSTVGPDKVDAFCKRVADCRRARGRAWELLPDWFRGDDSPIVGLFVSSSTLGPSSQRSLREAVCFSVEGPQLSQDLAQSEHAAEWLEDGALIPERFVAEFPLS
jgi:hypothetical protein